MELFNYLLLPILISEAVGVCMKLHPADLWDRVYTWGWNILLCLWWGHAVTVLLRILTAQTIAPSSVAYAIVMTVCHGLLCVLVHLISRKASVTVSWEHSKE